MFFLGGGGGCGGRRLVEGFWCLGSVRESKSVVVVGIIGYFA